ncbi:sigma factor-like helix-turn-helix DNA-binding protein [Streptomyces sp. SudanB25_2051]|uniref:sigma-70 region 4 domain-containing protein n=1 Tax=Streptomyces sp. SudanB25_2051 TaxID=3035275 RepID=UPI003F57A4F3
MLGDDAELTAAVLAAQDGNEDAFRTVYRAVHPRLLGYEALATGHTMDLIAQLPQDQAEAVILRVVVGLDAKSAAEALGKRPGAVRTAAHRGLKRLAELLGAGDPDGAALSAVPPQPGPRAGSGAQTPAARRAVTQSRSRTQKDM